MSDTTSIEPPVEIIKPEDIAGKNVVLRFLTSLPVRSLILGLIYSVGFNVIRAAVAAAHGHLRTSGGMIGYIDDPALYTNIPINAIVFAYWVWMPRGIAAAFNGLFNNGIIGGPTTAGLERWKKHLKKTTGEIPGKVSYTFSDLLKQAEGLYAKWWWSGISWAVVLAAVFVLILPSYLDLRGSASWTSDTVSLIMALIWVGFGAYMMITICYYGVFSIYYFFRLFRDFKLHIHPLHPDNAGGLSPMGDFTLMISYLIACVGLILVTTPMTRNYVVEGMFNFRWTPEIYAGMAAYLIIAPIGFFAPLSTARQAMKEAKDRLLLDIANRFKKEYGDINRLLESEDGLKLGDRLNNLEELQKLHDTTSKFPVWPFNVTNITRFSTSYIIPILVAVLAELSGGLLSR